MRAGSLIGLLEEQANGAGIMEDDSVVSDQRLNNHLQYSGQPYGDERDGHSKHISMDVWDAVESAKAIFQEVFSGARKVLRFNPEGEGDTINAWYATDYVHRQMFTHNKGFRLLRDAIHDAQVAKRCIWRAQWKEDISHRPLPQQPKTQQEVIAMMQAAQQAGMKLDYQNKQMVEVIDKSFTHIELVQPERFFRQPTTYIDDAQWCGEWGEYSRGQLINMGFDKDEIMKLKTDHSFRKAQEDDARKQQSGQFSHSHMHSSNKLQEMVVVYTTLTYLDLASDEFSTVDFPNDPPEGYQLYRFHWSCGELLTNPDNGEYWEAVDKYPYYEWTPYKISHAEHGMADADIIGHIQRSKTSLMRLIIDNQARSNSGQVLARRNSLLNPRELLENNIGSVLWVKSGQLEQAIQDRPQPALSAASFATLEMLDTQKEERTGHSRLAKGLNADAVSNQNADRMIERLTNASNRRVMRMVRDFAEELLVPVYMCLYENGRAHDKRTYTAEAQGQWGQYSPQQFRERQSTGIDNALAAGEAVMRATMLINLYTVMVQDPGVGAVFGAPQRHGLLDEIFELIGYKDSSAFVLSPNSDEFKQAQQQAQQAAQAQQLQAQQQMMFQMGLLKDEQKRKWADTRVGQGRLMMDATDKVADNQLEQRKFEHERVVDATEAQIERQQQRAVKV